MKQTTDWGQLTLLSVTRTQRLRELPGNSSSSASRTVAELCQRILTGDAQETACPTFAGGTGRFSCGCAPYLRGVGS